MRWGALFDDLEGQLAAADQRSLESEAAERARMDLREVGWLDRLAQRPGSTLTVNLATGHRFHGTLQRVGQDCLELDAHGRYVLVPMLSVVMIDGLSTDPASHPAARPRLGLRAALRDLSLARTICTWHLNDRSATTLSGLARRVGADYVDVAAADAAGRRPDPTPRFVPLTAIAAVVGPLADPGLA